jgi:hypothetical protein
MFERCSVVFALSLIEDEQGLNILDIFLIVDALSSLVIEWTTPHVIITLFVNNPFFPFSSLRKSHEIQPP